MVNTILMVCRLLLMSLSLFVSVNLKSIAPPSQQNLDSAFVDWNLKTMASLKVQQLASRDSLSKEYYGNRSLAFKAFWGIRTLKQINRNSIRYQFLKKIEKGKCFVLEEVQSGEVATIDNYVLNFGSSHKVMVAKYRYLKGDWKLLKLKSVEYTDSPASITTRFLPWSEGYNQDDLIITGFDNLKPTSSTFCLFMTLAPENVVTETIAEFERS